jgi:hypothetical protein
MLEFEGLMSSMVDNKSFHCEDSYAILRVLRCHMVPRQDRPLYCNVELLEHSSYG